MPLNLRFAILIVALFLMYVVYIILKQRMIPVKYSLLWGLAIFVMLLIGIFPSFLVAVANLMGFVTLANMITGVFIVILLFITISLTIIVSAQKKKITLLIQEVSIIKEQLGSEKEMVRKKD